MSVPLATTTISVFRAPQDIDPEDSVQPPWTIVVSDVRASITQPSAQRGQPTDETGTYTMSCDPFNGGLKRGDAVLDATTGTTYIVDTVWPSVVVTFGLEHIKAKLKLDRGINDGTAQF